VPTGIDATHDPARGSWVESANAPGTDFPIQNLPFGVFETGGSARGGVALGEFVVDLDALCRLGVLRGGALEAARAASGPSLAPLLARPLDEAGTLRAQLSNLFREGGTAIATGWLRRSYRWPK
jgi:fumarylacetoacetase